MNIVIDIETIPDQTPNAVDIIAEAIVVKAPDLTKPKLIEALKLGDKGKYSTVPELKEMFIEEFGQLLKLEQANEKWLKTSFDGSAGQICCASIDIDGQKITFSDHKFITEYSLISELWECISSITNGRKPMFIAHNAKFDLPFLFHRSVINNTKTPVGFKPHARNGSGVFCTMEAWAGFNGKIGLDRLSKALGVKGKGGMSGADVWPAYQRGEHEKIAEYCADDVRITKEIHKRLTFGV